MAMVRFIMDSWQHAVLSGTVFLPGGNDTTRLLRVDQAWPAHTGRKADIIVSGRGRGRTPRMSPGTASERRRPA